MRSTTKTIRYGALALTLLSAACGATTDHGAAPDGAVPVADGAPAPDAMRRTDTDVPLIGEVLSDCFSSGTTGGVAPGTDLEIHWLDLERFPDALCTDGSGAAIYFRPATTAEGRSRWLIELGGGGECSGQGCANRWCAIGTPIGARTMTTTVNTPPAMAGTGILNSDPREGTNPFADANLVHVRHCSQDYHAGTARDVVIDAFHPLRTDEAVRFRVHFLGARILDAAIATLRGEAGVLAHSGGRAMPDLDDAELVVLAGASAGGEGVISQLDRLASTLRAHDTDGVLDVRGLIDATVAPERSSLDWSTTTRCLGDDAWCSYESYLLGPATETFALRGDVGEDSCVAWHEANAPETAAHCVDREHLLRHHITSPVFVRSSLADRHHVENLVGSGFSVMGDLLTPDSYARVVRLELEEIASGTPEEPRTLPPGAFGPHCEHHEALGNDSAMYRVSVESGAGPSRMFDVWERWMEGAAGSVVVSATESESTCR